MALQTKDSIIQEWVRTRVLRVSFTPERKAISGKPLPTQPRVRISIFRIKMSKLIHGEIHPCLLLQCAGFDIFYQYTHMHTYNMTKNFLRHHHCSMFFLTFHISHSFIVLSSQTLLEMMNLFSWLVIQCQPFKAKDLPDKDYFRFLWWAQRSEV